MTGYEKHGIFGKDEVASSNLASSSIFDRNRKISVFFCSLFYTQLSVDVSNFVSMVTWLVTKLCVFCGTYTTNFSQENQIGLNMNWLGILSANHRLKHQGILRV